MLNHTICTNIVIAGQNRSAQPIPHTATCFSIVSPITLVQI